MSNSCVDLILTYYFCVFFFSLSRTGVFKRRPFHELLELKRTHINIALFFFFALVCVYMCVFVVYKVEAVRNIIFFFLNHPHFFFFV